jgi:hypothetical protein
VGTAWVAFALCVSLDLGGLNLTHNRYEQQTHLKSPGLLIALLNALQFAQVMGITEEMLAVIAGITLALPDFPW